MRATKSWIGKGDNTLLRGKSITNKSTQFHFTLSLTIGISGKDVKIKKKKNEIKVVRNLVIRVKLIDF